VASYHGLGGCRAREIAEEKGGSLGLTAIKGGGSGEESTGGTGLPRKSRITQIYGKKAGCLIIGKINSPDRALEKRETKSG